VAFDLVENEMQSFLAAVQEQLPKPPPPPAAAAAPAADAPADGAAPAPAADAMDTDAPAAAVAAANGVADAAAPAAAAAVEDPLLQRAGRLADILSGRTPISSYLDFLYHANAADLGVLKAIKGAVDARLSVCHSATILANAYMHAGGWGGAGGHWQALGGARHPHYSVPSTVPSGAPAVTGGCDWSPASTRVDRCL
jgi:26S proteasome regulatory subunit N2